MTQLIESNDAYVNYHPPDPPMAYGVLSLLPSTDPNDPNNMALRPLQAKLVLVPNTTPPTWKCYYIPCTTAGPIDIAPGEIIDANFTQEITNDNWTADTGWLIKKADGTTAPGLLMCAFARIALGSTPYTNDKGWLGTTYGSNFDPWIHHWSCSINARYQNNTTSVQTRYVTGFLTLTIEDSNVHAGVAPVIRLEPPGGYSNVSVIKE